MMFERIKNRFGLNEEEIEATFYEVLHYVSWEETREVEVEIVESRLVWSGGVEKIIEHAPANRGMYDGFIDKHGKPALDIREAPAYTERLDSWTETMEYTETKYAWVSEIPPGVEDLDKTKKVEKL